MTSPRDESLTGTNRLFPASVPSTVLIVFGTRPEAIKLCPLVAALRSPAYAGLIPVVCVTGQQRELLDQVLNVFHLQPDYDLALMQPGQTLTGLTSRLLAALEPVLSELKPSLVVVQGDTTTTFCAGLAAFYRGVPVAHVEAGLRTWDLSAPFPEELNRTVTSRLASLHFAPTEWAAANLRREGVPEERIQITGNTGIDAVLAVREALEKGELAAPPLPIEGGKKLVVVTAHRRESFGDGFTRICQAVSDLASRDDVQVIWPIHPNPNVAGPVNSLLGDRPNIALIDPLEYVGFVDLLRRAYLVITDSGGIQEEGPSLGKPILVLREKTERPEAVEAGTVKLVGSDRDAIVREAARLLDDDVEYQRRSQVHNPYGDGKASQRIADRIASFLNARTAV
ncbi:MAG: UDP-N-acetylglucosamine 2-epimerase (non-hydrolyzing) [Acidobacteriota bacterium]|nr:UDP-N-acetylglucosamine 2-epimerase (non-hydrolyzing) [Acidobacteriota bacterium]